MFRHYLKNRLVLCGLCGTVVGFGIVAPMAGSAAIDQAEAYGVPYAALTWLYVAVFLASPLCCAGIAAILGYLTSRRR